MVRKFTVDEYPKHRLAALEPDMVPGRKSLAEIGARWFSYATTYSTKLVWDYAYGVEHGRHRDD